ncbi:phosphopantetheine attachment site family protein [Collimonas fungivorans]|uniref:Phosphopantetheine attachment site family protein n=1 Tax=Collimonas fungivorans TaxID=158899 RepID=A0A127PB95_9BURK|nr:phosphopantetheine-binding protein [Collimonas fungivorans]AMO94711.1 phosphopantetheine attachment site family protein [Collimonas fungivorans]
MDRNHITSIVKKHIANAVEGVNESNIDLQKSMTDYGASSLDIVSVVSGAMRELKIKIPRTELKNVKNINGLIDMFVTSSAG